MKTKILLSALISSLIVFGCTKDKFTDNPQLILEDINTTSVHQNQTLTFTFTFSLKKNSLDTLFIKRISKICYNNVDSNLTNIVPPFTSAKKESGTLEVNFNIGGDLQGCIGITDSSYFMFCLQDVAGKKSDTVTSPVIAILPN
jgi:hypothetical protein